MLKTSEIAPKRLRGNPYWGKPMPPSFLTEQPTKFEAFLGKLGIEEEGCEAYPLVRTWVEKHKNLYYIPEELLKKCHAEVEIGDSVWL